MMIDIKCDSNSLIYSFSMSYVAIRTIKDYRVKIQFYRIEYENTLLAIISFS